MRGGEKIEIKKAKIKIKSKKKFITDFEIFFVWIGDRMWEN